eukprot:TRINITY_DN340_c0_g1_i1.p1 TRINITY_DN340_c0_g1~~TRINITY_DN340_c0_g1_i1.p1  ORF type:complete len:377 (+),score=68.31 TRINITY_DN340_c0_g1_i1:61-1191(+)
MTPSMSTPPTRSMMGSKLSNVPAAARHAHNTNNNNPARGGKTLRIKDPAAKGNVMYDVPLELIELTHGSREHWMAMNGGDRKPSHRACLCKLFLDNRCGQGEKCKSLHVNVEFVQKSRQQRGVVIDDQFMNEVVVVTKEQIVFAVRFPAVLRTKGLDYYKRACKQTESITPFPLCSEHNPGLGMTGVCKADRNCDKIHVKHAELKDLNECRLRTPCCGLHGDGAMPNGSVAVLVGEKMFQVPMKHLSYTSLQLCKPVFGPNDVCSLHIRSRCKYGRSCGKMHVCRKFADDKGFLEAVERSQGVSVTPPRSPKQESLNSAMSTPRREELYDSRPCDFTLLEECPPPLVEEDESDILQTLLTDDFQLPEWNQDSPYQL